MLRIVVGEQRGVAGRTCGTGYITSFLELGEDGKVDVDHILLRPHSTAVVEVVFVVVVAVGSQLQRNFVLVVVVLVVVTHTDKDCQLVVLQCRHVVHQVVGVYKHL